MNLRREATKTIWKTVVFAGAMLGSAGCSKKQPQTTPTADTAPDTTVPDDTAANPCADTATNPCADAADPCADNPCRDRGVAGEGEGDTGRGFILS